MYQKPLKIRKYKLIKEEEYKKSLNNNKEIS